MRITTPVYPTTVEAYGETRVASALDLDDGGLYARIADAYWHDRLIPDEAFLDGSHAFFDFVSEAHDEIVCRVRASGDTTVVFTNADDLADFLQGFGSDPEVYLTRVLLGRLP
ncbi:MAG TPA: hypothetical protein VGB79_01690 [Allosphingosinicella sp.]